MTAEEKKASDKQIAAIKKWQGYRGPQTPDEVLAGLTSKEAQSWIFRLTQKRENPEVARLEALGQTVQEPLSTDNQVAAILRMQAEGGMPLTDESYLRALTRSDASSWITRIGRGTDMEEIRRYKENFSQDWTQRDESFDQNYGWLDRKWGNF